MPTYPCCLSDLQNCIKNSLQVESLLKYFDCFVYLVLIVIAWYVYMENVEILMTMTGPHTVTSRIKKCKCHNTRNNPRERQHKQLFNPSIIACYFELHLCILRFPEQLGLVKCLYMLQGACCWDRGQRSISLKDLGWT